MPKDDRTFLKNVAKLSLGNFGRYLISFLAAPILSRLYTPDEFGRFGVFLSVTVIISTWATLGYEAAIVPAKSDDEASKILTLTTLALFINSLITVGLVYLAQILKPDLTAKYSLWLAPLAVLSNGAVIILTFWNNRYENYSRISISRAAVPFMSSLTQIALFRLKSLGLIVGIIWGKFFSTFFLLKRLRFSKDLKSILATAKRLYRYPTYYLGSSLLYVLSQYIPIILLEHFFSSSVSGIYTFVNRIILTPIGLIGISFGQVFFREISGAKPEEIERTTIKTMHILLKLSIPFFLLLLFGGPAIFETIFGARWTYAGEVARIFSFWMIVIFITSPLTFIFLVSERQKDLFWFNVVLLISRTLSILFGALMQNYESAFLMLGAMGFLIRLGVLFRISMLAKAKAGALGSLFVKEIAVPLALFALFEILARFFGHNTLIRSVIFVSAGLLSYIYTLREIFRRICHKRVS